MGKDNVKVVWKKNFDDLYIVEKEKQVTMNMHGFEGVKMGVSLWTASKRNWNVTRYIIKNGSQLVRDCYGNEFDIAFEKWVVPEGFRTTVV